MASQVCTALKERGVKSVILVTRFYHSKRSALTYKKFLEPNGVKLISYPVQEGFASDNWWKTKDGRRAVLNELIELQYYRLFVL